MSREKAAVQSAQPESTAKKLVLGAFDVLEMFAWAMFIVLILFTFAFRLCRVDGASMEDTLRDRESLLLYSIGYTPEQDDVIVFHVTENDTEKTLVKRVIATGGQTLVIDVANKTITVDGVKYEDSHRTLKNRWTGASMNAYSEDLFEHHPNYNKVTKCLTVTVPEGYVFVLGDNRNNSKDSRDTDIGLVDERCILGKAFLRLSPFTLFN